MLSNSFPLLGNPGSPQNDVPLISQLFSTAVLASGVSLSALTAEKFAPGVTTQGRYNGIESKTAEIPELITGVLGDTLANISGKASGSIEPEAKTPLNPTQAAAAAEKMRFALSSYVGSDSWLPAGWQRSEQTHINGIPLSDPDSGLTAAVFKNADTGEHVLSFRGTNAIEPQLKDWHTDFQLGLNKVPSQFESAIKLGEAASTVYGDSISVTGHSLGGGLAQAAGLAGGLKTTAFDPAGINPAIVQILGDRYDNNQGLVENFNAEGNFVTDIDGLRQPTSATGELLPGASYFYTPDRTPLVPDFLDNNFTRHIPTAGLSSLEKMAGQTPSGDLGEFIRFGTDYLFSSFKP